MFFTSDVGLPHKVTEFLPQNLIYNPYIFATQYRIPKMYQTMNSLKSNKFKISKMYTIKMQ